MRRTMGYLLGACVAFLVGALANQSAAQDSESPRLNVVIPVEVENDWTYNSDDPNAELNDLFAKAEPEAQFYFLPNLSILVHGVLEPVQGPGPRDDRAFDDEGLFIEDLYVAYETGPFALRAGKFTPDFGRAWEDAPGVFGTDFAVDGYEFAERIGVGGEVSVAGGAAGSLTLAASTFFLDTTVLSRSAITNRGRTTLSSGGVSNTEDFSSFALALSGVEIPMAPGLSYYAAFIHQAKGRGDTAAENGFALAADHSFALGNVTVVPFAEFAWFDDATGVSGQSLNLLTTSLQFDWDQWNFALSRTARTTDPAGGPDVDDVLLQLSIGYEFDSGVALNVGWKHTEEGAIDTGVAGLLLTYTFEL